jgi:DNA invertase Pin-like site-specific DNA recombinase
MKRRPIATDPRAAVAYLRVSTDAERQAHGLDVQREAIATWAAREGVRLVGWHQDEISGTTAHQRRPGLGAALLELRQQRAGVLVVHRIDRLARDAHEGAIVERVLQDAGAQIVAIEGGGDTNDPAGRLVRQIMLAAAEFEGALIRDRIRATKASLRRRGLLEGGEPPYGWAVGEGRRLVPCDEERAMLARLEAWRAEGLSLRRIALEARRQGLLNRRGKPLRHQTIATLLKRGPCTAAPSV